MRSKQLTRRKILFLIAAWAALASPLGEWGAPIARAADVPPYHLVVLGDPHLPGKFLPAKYRVLQTINSWADVDAVAVLGDICEDAGTAVEYAAAKQFFATLAKPAFFIAGNHDYIYEDAKNAQGSRVRGSPESRSAKLARFRETFGVAEIYSSRRLDSYLLIFLSTDHLFSNHLAEMSDRQLGWLRAELAKNPHVPTAIFFHAPLKGTLFDFNERANTDSFVAQPQAELRELLLKNPQVFLWVAGHMHVPATNESFRSDINLYERQVAAIHATDMNRERIWTNSLFFYPDRVVVKTFDHKAGAWMEKLERTILPPRT